ncbi:hypothetical protein FYK55_17380 [Roseiconus nitratireducens]|uniref:BNR repeat neuraminidase n=2 Tax=Roseiconus nitratireducens TaxID=2605748 RepID=A0A5M6D2I7_9BACT|nr:hypothetical protein FYK55_17380 [Roseiconus nitratireducens]
MCLRLIHISLISLVLACPAWAQPESESDPESKAEKVVTLNTKADGYRGIWYMNQPSGDEYVYKYSGGLGTYCAKHKPFAIYCPEVNKTFFCYGGSTAEDNRQLLHMVSYFDHESKQVPRPTILLDKQTNDAHDNPVISIDSDGHLWIFSTSHGRSRPSYIHRSVRPYDIEEFELVHATQSTGDQEIPITNFSYMQIWHSDKGFHAFFTRYGDPAARTIGFMSSSDGRQWSSWQRLAAIEQGHYQVSGIGIDKLGTSFNYHPQGKGLNWRTNLYYLETEDNGDSWHTVDGQPVEVPLTDVQNPALVHDFESEGLNVYLKDLRYDARNRPVLLYVTSGGYEAGPGNDPRTWWISRWTGKRWERFPITTSDNNYDFGELSIVSPYDWRLIGPTESGPQPYNPGGEVAMWRSVDRGRTWNRVRQLTQESPMNHTYVRRVLHAHPDFVAFWADGHGRQPSESRLYLSNSNGDVYRFPESFDGPMTSLEKVP